MTLRNYAAIAYRDVYVNQLIVSPLIPGRVRRRMLNRLGHDIDPTASINANQFIGAMTGLTVGARAHINYGCFFDLCASTTIGADSGLSYGVMIITCNHELGDHGNRWNTPTTTAPVVIGDGCWIGARAMILPGVTIGDGCVIAAGSVIASDCEPDGIYAGVPGRLKRRLSPDTIDEHAAQTGIGSERFGA